MTQGELFELGLAIGDVTIGLRCWDEEFAHVLSCWCGKFRSERSPDFWLEIELREGRCASAIQRILPELRVKTEGAHFRSDPQLWEGTYSATGRLLRFSSERALFDLSTRPRWLNILLSSVYNTVCESRAGATRAWHLVHGCGVVVDGRGYLFTGPSGVGKTTVARLSQDRTVLNDEVVLLRSSARAVRMIGTPLLGGVNRRSGECVQVQAILMLRPARDTGLRRLDRKESFQQFLAQVFDLAPVWCSEGNRRQLLGQQIEFSGAVLNEVPAYELRFQPDGSFWPLLEAL